MVIYLYRWKLKPDKEKQFQEAWAYVTEQLRDHCGSLGSRLHRGDDGLWYGYAQWPSTEFRENAKLQDKKVFEARQLMKQATVEMLPEVVLTPISDFLLID